MLWSQFKDSLFRIFAGATLLGIAFGVALGNALLGIAIGALAAAARVLVSWAGDAAAGFAASLTAAMFFIAVGCVWSAITMPEYVLPTVIGALVAGFFAVAVPVTVHSMSRRTPLR